MAEVIYRNGLDVYKVTLDSENVIDQIFKKNASGEYVQLSPKSPKIKVFLNNHNSVAMRMSFKRFHVICPDRSKLVQKAVDKYSA